MAAVEIGSSMGNEIGHSDTRQFIRSFKQMFGVTPDRFRKVEQQTVH